MRKWLGVVLGALAVGGCDSGPPPPAPAPTIHVPADRVLLDDRVPGWSTYAWATSDAVCVQATQPRREPGLVSCGTLPEVDGPVLVTRPVPQVAPSDPESARVLLVGTAVGPVTTVDVEVAGRTTTGEVRRLRTAGGRAVGAYAVWVARGAEGFSSSDVTAVVGRDADGRLVTGATQT